MNDTIPPCVDAVGALVSRARSTMEAIHASGSVPHQPPVRPEGDPRMLDARPTSNVHTARLAQTLAIHGIGWNEALVTALALSAGQKVSILIPCVPDGPMLAISLVECGIHGTIS